jgi:hypothetical protein
MSKPSALHREDPLCRGDFQELRRGCDALTAGIDGDAARAAEATSLLTLAHTRRLQGWTQTDADALRKQDRDKWWAMWEFMKALGPLCSRRCYKPWVHGGSNKHLPILTKTGEGKTGRSLDLVPLFWVGRLVAKVSPSATRLGIDGELTRLVGRRCAAWVKAAFYAHWLLFEKQAAFLKFWEAVRPCTVARGDDVARVFRQVYSSPHKSPAQANASATLVRYACVSAAGMGSRRQWHQRQEVNSLGWRFS